RPATMRSNVDLPQPDGPTMTMNSPSDTCISTPWITSRVAYRLVMLRSSTLAIDGLARIRGEGMRVRDVFRMFGRNASLICISSPKYISDPHFHADHFSLSTRPL